MSIYLLYYLILDPLDLLGFIDLFNLYIFGDPLDFEGLGEFARFVVSIRLSGKLTVVML